MERKVTEWGCMQALIDFDGWRQWKAYAKAKESEDPAKKAAREKEEKDKQKAALKAMFKKPPPSSSNIAATSSTTKKEEKPTANGNAKKPAPGGKHKNSRSNGSAILPNALGSVGEVDETPSR